MKLIATLGASKIENKFKYKLNDDLVDETYCSFSALKKHYDLSNGEIIIIGTKQTKERLDAAKDKIGEFENFINLDELEISNDGEFLFSFINEKIIKFLDDEIILDLTQGFRHHPISLFASAILSKDYRPKEIFYAKDISGNNTEFEYLNLISVLDNSSVAILVDTYIKNGGVAYISNPSSDVKKLIKMLSNLSSSLLVNQYKKSINSAKNLNDFIDESKKISLKDSFNKLKNDIDILTDLENKPEYIQLIKISKYLRDKELLAQSIQFLFEGILAFIEFYIAKKDPNFNIKFEVGKKEVVVKISDKFRYERELYKRRNSIKRDFSKNNAAYAKYFGDSSKKLQKMLSKIDKKRNDISHPNDDSEASSTNFGALISNNLSNLEKIISELKC